MTIHSITQQTISTETAIAELLLAVLTKQDKLQQKLEILQAENKDLRRRVDLLENEKTGLLGRLARQEEQTQGNGFKYIYTVDEDQTTKQTAGQLAASRLEEALNSSALRPRQYPNPKSVFWKGTCGSGSCGSGSCDCKA